MVNIFFDDVRPCPVGFIEAKNVQTCISLLEECRGNINILSLDYDIIDQDTKLLAKETGLDVVDYLVQTKIFPKTVYLHSANELGRKAMREKLCSLTNVKIHNSPMPFFDAFGNYIF